MIRFGLSTVGVVLLANVAYAEPPREAPAAKQYVAEGHEELLLARTAEQHKEYAQRVAHLNQAMEDFQAALRVMPNDYHAYEQMGYCEFMNGRLYHAIQDFNAAIALDPQAARTYMVRGNVYYQLGQPETAAKDWEVAVRIDPSIGPKLSANLAEQQRLYREVHAPPGA